MEQLTQYASSGEEDYHVRAAAAHALGQVGDPSALPAARQAAEDEEWCTACEGRKAVAKLTR